MPWSPLTAASRGRPLFARICSCSVPGREWQGLEDVVKEHPIRGRRESATTLWTKQNVEIMDVDGLITALGDETQLPDNADITIIGSHICLLRSFFAYCAAECKRYRMEEVHQHVCGLPEGMGELPRHGDRPSSEVGQGSAQCSDCRGCWSETRARTAKAGFVGIV